jgi:hypothetical protein
MISTDLGVLPQAWEARVIAIIEEIKGPKS